MRRRGVFAEHHPRPTPPIPEPLPAVGRRGARARRPDSPGSGVGPRDPNSSRCREAPRPGLGAAWHERTPGVDSHGMRAEEVPEGSPARAASHGSAKPRLGRDAPRLGHAASIAPALKCSARANPTRKRLGHSTEHSSPAKGLKSCALYHNGGLFRPARPVHSTLYYSQGTALPCMNRPKLLLAAVTATTVSVVVLVHLDQKWQQEVRTPVFGESRACPGPHDLRSRRKCTATWRVRSRWSAGQKRMREEGPNDEDAPLEGLLRLGAVHWRPGAPNPARTAPDLPYA